MQTMAKHRHHNGVPLTSTIHVSAIKHSLVLLYRALSAMQHTDISNQQQ